MYRNLISKCTFSRSTIIQFGYISFIAPTKANEYNYPSLRNSISNSTLSTIDSNTIDGIYKKPGIVEESLAQPIQPTKTLTRVLTTNFSTKSRMSFDFNPMEDLDSRTEKIQSTHPRPQNSPQSWMPRGLRFEKVTEAPSSWINLLGNRENPVIFSGFLVLKCIFV